MTISLQILRGFTAKMTSDISIVIPVFKESKKIAADIKVASEFLLTNHLSGEIIVVDDGSGDNTAKVAKDTIVPAEIDLKVIRVENNRGKGYAVRTGIEQSSGKYVMFIDSGCCVPYKYILDGLELLKRGDCDIAHASRKLSSSKICEPQTYYRRICSAVFRWFLIWAMKIPSKITDSQCGFKIYKGDLARDLYGRCITDGFMFDVEIILLALKKGYRIKEFSIDWTCDRDSRLSPARYLVHVFSELRTIKQVLNHPN